MANREITRRTILSATAAATATLAAPAAIADMPVLAGSTIADLVRLYRETDQRRDEARDRADIVYFQIKQHLPEIPDSIKMDVGIAAPNYIAIDPSNIERERERRVTIGWSKAEAARWAEETERTRCEYEAACAAFLATTEWPELDRRADELQEAMRQIEESIIAAEPQSLAELGAKLRFAARQEGYIDVDDDESDITARFFRSIVRDVERLVGVMS